MAGVLSKELKAMLVMEDIMEQGVSVWQGNCFTVQHFSYELHRGRDGHGLPFGATLPSFMEFSVKVSSDSSGKLFFKRMHQDQTFPFSFIFNAVFNAQGRLTDCDDSMVASGYLIDVEEIYGEESHSDGTDEQMLIKARLLLSNIAYAGRDKTLNLIITND